MIDSNTKLLVLFDHDQVGRHHVLGCELMIEEPTQHAMVNAGLGGDLTTRDGVNDILIEV